MSASIYGDCYNKDYVGVWDMIAVDCYGELTRWFYNYVVTRDVYAPSSYEWMTIEEIVTISPTGKEIRNYIGTIGADHLPTTRTVHFETNAPPPPTFMRPAKEKYVPPTPMAILEKFNRISKILDDMENRRYSNSLTEQQRKTAMALPPVKIITTYRRNQ